MCEVIRDPQSIQRSGTTHKVTIKSFMLIINVFSILERMLRIAIKVIFKFIFYLKYWLNLMSPFLIQ